MDSQALLKTMQVVWRNSQGTAENARGASGGLGTVWNTNKFELISADSTTHWIHTKLLHKATDRLVSLFNIYVPQILLEKQQCWETLKDYLQHNDLDNIILGGDLNVTLAQGEKKGGSIVRDPAREWVEDLMSDWDLEDVKPTKGRYTWSNKRVGLGHIAARLDRFLVQSSYLLLGLNTTSTILPHSVSDHKPILLEILSDNSQGPIPFRFSPA
jgi:exonuclease III